MSGVAARGVLRLVVMKLSACSRFVVLEGLHIDRKVLEPLASWGAGHGLTVQDAIQVAICAFNEGACRMPCMGPVLPRREVRAHRPWHE